MELEDFKSLYQKKQSSGSELNSAELEQIVRSRSTTAIEKIIRNMWIELGFGAAISLAVGIGAFFVKGSLVYHMCAVLMIVVALAQIIIYRPVFVRLRTLQEASTSTTKAWLEALVAYMEKFVRIYTRTMLISTPAAAIIGGGIGYYAGTKEQPDTMMPEQIDFQNPTDMLLLLVIGTAVLVFTYFGIKWTVHFFYGKPLQQLKQALSELNADEV